MGIAAVGAAASVASAAYSMSQGGGDTSVSGAGGSVPTGYQPTAQPQFDQYYQNLTGPMVGSAQSLPGMVLPHADAAYNNLAANPYAGAAQRYSDMTSNFLMGSTVPFAQGDVNSLQNLGNQGAVAAGRILDTGFDPQNALYDRMQQQIKDQLSAINSMSGLSGTPYGAGVMGQGLSNFNIDWQNQQLQRQATAANAYGGLSSSIGRDYSGAADLGSLAASLTNQAGQIPYQTYAAQQGDVLNAGNALSGAYNSAYGLDQNTLNALSAYMKLGQSATGIGQAGQGQAFGQGQQLGANFGAGLQGLSSGISGLSGLFGGGGVSSSSPISYGGGSYGSNADMLSAFPGFDFSAAG